MFEMLSYLTFISQVKIKSTPKRFFFPHDLITFDMYNKLFTFSKFVIHTQY